MAAQLSHATVLRRINKKSVPSMCGDPGETGERGDTAPIFLGKGTAVTVSHPIISPLSYTFYGSLAFTCTSTVCTRIHKE